MNITYAFLVWSAAVLTIEFVVLAAFCFAGGVLMLTSPPYGSEALALWLGALLWSGGLFAEMAAMNWMFSFRNRRRLTQHG
jgi:hypothetical protein